MRVESVINRDGKERYVVGDYEGRIIEPVVKFLKYRDNSGAARNTLRTYSYHLKLYFEFLNQIKVDYLEVSIDEFASFIGWLQMPKESIKVMYIGIQESKRCARTINAILNTTLLFYDYIMRHENYENQISEKLKKLTPYSQKGFKGFLYHISKNKFFKTHIIKLKVPKTKPKTLERQQIKLLMEGCTNKRDVFLIRLLWESSMRIGEALSLWIEDFSISETKIFIRDRGELINNAEIKTVYSPRALDVSQELMDEFMDYIAEIHSDEVDTNFVFIKLTGENKYKPMEYQDVVSLFNRLKKKIGLKINPHMLRHSSLTELRRCGWEAEHLRVRAGHKSFQTTFQMYIHPNDEDMRKDWERVKSNMEVNLDMKGTE